MLHNYTNGLGKVLLLCACLFGSNAIAQNCTVPEGITITQGMAHTVVNFTSPLVAPQLGYDWELKVLGSETILQSGTITSNSFLIQNLTPSTQYMISLRLHCQEGVFGDWASSNVITNSEFSQFSGQVGIGTSTDLSLYGPILYTSIDSRKGSVANMLYSAEELEAIGIPTGAQITKVAFNKTSTGSNATAPYTPIRMRVLAANSTNVAPLSTTQTLADVETTHTEVMDNDSFTIPGNLGWVDFDFVEPFTFTGDALEIATVFYQTMDTPQFSGIVSWQFTAGYKEHVAGAWPLPTIDMDAPETIILSHNSGSGQYKDRPNIMIFYQLSNVVEELTLGTLNDVAPEITLSQSSLQLVSAIAPSRASQQVVWEIISGAEYATIDQNGLVSAFADGTVVVRVTSAENETIYQEITISITNQFPCEIVFPDGVEPISSVKFAGIDNQSSASIWGNTPAQEDFTGISAMVSLGGTYIIEVKGNTNGNFIHTITAYFDWNKNNSFEDEGEAFTVGNLQNSTGIDNVTAIGSITIPQDVPLGNTKMRIIKKFNSAALPCNTTGYGQAEDYKVVVNNDPVTGIDDFEKSIISIYPNPTNSMVNIVSKDEIQAIVLYNSLGQQVLQAIDSKQLDMSALSNGIYLLKAHTDNSGSQTFKVIKK